MTQRLLRAGCALIAALAFSLTASAAEPYEMLGGNASCSGHDGEVYAFATLWSSGDIFPKDKWFWRNFEASAPVAESFCSAQIETLEGILSSEGCTVGAVVDPNLGDGVFERSFDFVCDAPRRRLVRLGADLYAAFLSLQP